ncbi:MAG: hypothetical protein S4CHLAM6_07750 [Chlamydiae bacterium]|nr:hypothetical protein [Chlamydiota bacterium]
MRSKNFIIPLMCLLFAFCLEMPLASSAMSFQTVKGSVSLVEQKEVTKIHASDNSVVEYSSFDVEEGKEIKVIQPSEDSILVIRVKSNQPTRIRSKLSANGKVYLFNPKGIFLDKEAQIEKGTFYFVGSELLTENVGSDLNILPTTGDVVNHGNINSMGEVHLIGRHVVNSGTINAIEKVKIAQTNAKDQLSILHTGTIQSKNVFIEARNGTCEIYGKIDSKNTVENQYGGNICILGQQVRLIGAYLDASGTFRGGQVNLGGDLEGKGPLFKATRTSVDDATVIDASAIEYGHGGEVVVWSEELTSFQGEIFARGGRKYGAGGRVETSSSNHLGIFSGRVNVGAACGEQGQWMLDPSNIVITDAEEASDNLSLVSEFPAKSGSQVTISVQALNNFAGGKLQIAATNRITIDANIENISSTLDLTFRAGSQIRLKNEEIKVPNGKVSFIIENEESGQVVCSKDFKGITAHELVVVAPRGQKNGFQVETNSLVLNPTNANRSNPSFVFETDVIAKNNSNHQLYLRRSKGACGSIVFEGSLEGFNFVNSETNLKVVGESQIGHLVTKGATKVELLGGGHISELAELENLSGITIGNRPESNLKVNGALNTTSSVTKLCGTIETQAEFEANDVKLIGNTVINTNNNPFVVHLNITQENVLADLAVHTGSAHTTVEGSVYANDFSIDSTLTPALCGEVCVFNFTSNTPEVRLGHDLVVSGQMNCLNLTTSGENKKVAFAKGGIFKGKTSFNHTGTTTLGDHEAASFSFEDMLDTHKSITYSHGLIYVQGPVEINELALLGDTSIQCDQYSCNIEGSVTQQECNANFDVNTKTNPITFGKYIQVEGLSLNTSSLVKIEVPVHVTSFTTSSPSVEFTDHLFVEGVLSSNNISTTGQDSQVSICGGAQINGSALFENEASITLGQSPDSEFVIGNRLSCSNCSIKVQGSFDVTGQVDLYDVELFDHTNFKTHGHNFNVEKAVSQNTGVADFSVSTDAGHINFGSQIYVNDLNLVTSAPIYVGSELDAINVSTTSPLLTFAGNTMIQGQLESLSIATLGSSKKFQLNHGGKVSGDAKIANGGTFIVGQAVEDTLELLGPLDRSNGETVAQGTIRSHAGTVDFEKLTLSGTLSVLSVSNDGEGQEITFHSEVDGAHQLNVNAASSVVNIERPFGASDALTGLTVYANLLNTKADITLERGAGEFYTNIKLDNNVQVKDLGREGLFFYGKIDGNYDLDLISNQMVVVKKDIGSTVPLNAVNVSAKRIDVWASVAANSGAINFNGDVEICENVKLVNCGSTGICFNGKVDGDFFVELRVKDKGGKISFNEDIGQHQPLRHVVLSTSSPVTFNKKVHVDNFETTAPNTIFYNDVLVAGDFNVHNVLFDGARQNVNLMGGGQILGNATFNNKGDLTLGADDQVEFNVGGILSRVDGPTYARGIINTNGALADFSALHAVGNLKLTSFNPAGTSFNFNSTLDGAHNITVDSKNGSVNFYDYVGNHHPLASLDVNAPIISMQRQITVKDGDIALNGDLNLVNHSSIRNEGGEKIFISGNVNGEWNLSIYANANDAQIVVAGAIGGEHPINYFNVETSNKVDFNKNVTVYNLNTTSPLITFNNDVEIKQHVQANNIVMNASEGQFTILGGGYLTGDLELCNTSGTTILGDSRFCSLTTEGKCSIYTANTFAQGLIQSSSSSMEFNKLHLNGPLKVASTAQKSKGESITFNHEVVGAQAFEIDAGVGQVAFSKSIGDDVAMQSLNVKGSTIALGGNVNLAEGSAVFQGDVNLTNDVIIRDQGKGCITFLGQVNGAYDLEIFNQHEAGQITFTNAVGSQQALNTLQMTTQNAVEFPRNIEVATLNTTAPALTFADEATISKDINAHHLVTKGKFRAVRLLGNGNFSGMTTFSNSGSLVLGGNDSSEFVFSGPLSVQNCVLISQGQIRANGSIALTELSLKGSTSFDTQDNEFKVTGIVEQINDGSNLNIEAGSGQVTFGNSVTANNLKFNTALPVEFHSSVKVVELETKAPHVLFANNVTVEGAITANDITTAGSENKVKFLGGGEIKGNSVFKNGAGIFLGGSEQSVITFHGPLDTTASLLEARGTIQTINKTIDLGNMSVVGNTTIRSTYRDSSGKNIYFLGVVEGPKQLRANAGNAKICFENHVGSQTALESLQATASSIELDGDVRSQDGNVVFAGDVVFTNTSNLTADGQASIIFQGTVNVDGNAKGPVDLILDATGKIEFQKDVGDSKGFNEVIVTRAGELVCRSPLKSNIITQSQAVPLQKVEAKTAESEKQSKEVEATQNISKNENAQNVHES